MGKILLTGGAGYIGSHVAKKLSQAGYEVITYDNLSTGHSWAVLNGSLVIGDICDKTNLREVFLNYDINIVMHFAANIVVPESIDNPLKYYLNNVSGTLTLLDVMNEFNVDKLIFSSTAAVYGIPAVVPVKESMPINPINPYGWSKAMVEQILADLSGAGKLSYIALRYFNAAGADKMGKIGEGKKDASHLITRAIRTALGIYDHLEVYGTDYPTPDGTCIRDYIHVEDLAQAHVLAVDYLLRNGASQVLNCGYNRGFSVFEVISAVKKTTGVDFPIILAPRRLGDPPNLIADSQKIKSVLNWQPEYADLSIIISSAWAWEKNAWLFLKN